VKVVLVGEGSAATQVFQALRRRQIAVVAVLTSPPDAKDRSAGGLWNIVSQAGLEPWPARLVQDPQLAERLRATGLDILLNVYSLYVIRSEILTAPPLGSYNLHPGPLPKYAGLNSMCWAIYRGERRHGVTVHQMVPKIDAGPIVFQEMFAIEEQDTGLSVATKCIEVGVGLILRLLEAAQSSAGIPLAPQDLSQRGYFGREVPQEGRIRWVVPARHVFNFVRACDFGPFASPWGHPKTFFQSREMTVTKTSLTGRPCHLRPGTVGDVTTAGADVACQDEWLLIQRIQVDKKSCSPIEVLKPGAGSLDRPELGHELL
jgi:UDP-4-amino-4-deoxy-L-arabinose formyltransferase/UDP-glucuronic acid dehydrogenase (UDP-4-keto-hexauronic acid decarboxylating)